MNTTTSHLVEGTDLPTYEPGFTDQGVLHLGGGVKVIVPDRHVDWLRQLGYAVEAAVQLLDATRDQPAEPAELQHPETWLPGDQIIDADGDTFTRRRNGWQWAYGEGWTDGRIGKMLDAPGATITHLVPRENGAV